MAKLALLKTKIINLFIKNNSSNLKAMKTITIIFCLLISTISVKAQSKTEELNIYNDAVNLSKKDISVDEVKSIFNKYGIKDNRNIYLSDLFIDFNLRNKGIPVDKQFISLFSSNKASGKISGKIGGLEITPIADGLAQFIVSESVN